MSSSPAKQQAQKWQRIIAAFKNNQLDELLSIQRSGSRGRIFHILVEDMLKSLLIPFQPHPFFDHKEIDSRYIDFASKHNLKLRTHEFYNPDFLLEDRTWLEISLSENTAYQKLFRYGYQAPQVMIIWLDEDDRLHKSICKDIEFPNAAVLSMKNYYTQLNNAVNGNMLIENFERLKKLKGSLL